MDERQLSQIERGEVSIGSKETKDVRTAKHWNRLPRKLWRFCHRGFKYLTQQSPEQPGLTVTLF